MAELSPEDQNVAQLSDTVYRVLREVRDNTLDAVGESYESTPQFAAIEFENVANGQLNKSVRNARLGRKSKDVFTDIVRDVTRDYSNSNSAFTQQQNARFYSETFKNSVRDAAEEMLRRARVLVRNGVVSGESWSDVRQRVADTYNDDELRNRANIIAHMELTKARETTKLQQFEANEDIVGVEVHNTDPSTRVTTQLNGARAFFEEGEIDNQLAQQVRADALREGFNPLPRTPPYHFNDTTTLEPVYKDEVNTQ